MKKESGMDIDLGNKCSKIAYDWAKKSFQFRKGKSGMLNGDLDGLFANSIIYQNEQIGISSDGIGTKIEIAERLQKYDTLGFDLVAMVADDLVASGFEPTNLSNIIDVDFLDYSIIDKLMNGLYEAAKVAKIAITGGEIAELGTRICGFGNKMHFNWTATAIGSLIKNLRKPISGKDIQVGDKVISLKSRGFRSNGFSPARKILKDKFGENWHKEKYSEQKSWGEVMLTPSLIYSPMIVKLFEKNHKINGIVHITGGGIPDNLNRVLKLNGLGAYLHNLFEPSEAMKSLAEISKIELKKLYKIWNMGNGMLLIVHPSEAESILKNILKNGYKAKISGVITAKRKIIIDTFEEKQIEY